LRADPAIDSFLRQAFDLDAIKRKMSTRFATMRCITCSRELRMRRMAFSIAVSHRGCRQYLLLSQKPGILKNRALQIAEAAKLKSKTPRRVTFQLCTISDISTWLQHNSHFDSRLSLRPRKLLRSWLRSTRYRCCRPSRARSGTQRSDELWGHSATEGLFAETREVVRHLQPRQQAG
jgi:hypothetical protein